MRYAFVIDGPLLGYRASRQGHTREYKKYKEMVHFLAQATGWRESTPTIKAPVFIGVTIFWAKGARIDWKNVVGAIEDGLYGQDRYVLPGHHAVVFNSGHELARVEIDT